MWTFVLGVMLSSAVGAPLQQPASGQVAILGATLIDGTGGPPLENAVIIVANGRITAVGAAQDTPVPAGARIVDAAGKFAIPGLADMHTHLGSGAFVFSGEDYPVNLKRLLAFGVTTAFVPSIPDATFRELKALTANDSGPYPRVLGVGVGFGTIGGQLPHTGEEARALVRELRSLGVDAVKLAYDDLTWLTTRSALSLSPEVMSAIIDEAHVQGLRVFVHAPLLHHAKEALRAGADGLLHGILSGPVDEEFLSLMAANGAVYVSTFGLFEGVSDIDGWAQRQESFDVNRLTPADVYASLKSPGTVDQWESTWDNLAYTRTRLPQLRTNLSRVRAAGIPVAIGTDSGIPGVVLGVSLQLEIALHVEAGVPPLEAIGLATLGAARMARLENEIGSIETGKRGDIVLVDADPIADIRNLSTASVVLRGGVPYTPEQLLR
jgi:imidazolonepropionase-like amidohydrolase